MNEPEELSPEPTSFAEWAEDARRRARKKQIAATPTANPS